jgi:23S rRNA (cytidine1920-2'-O)/16S rRNA (cytidine1409-2'-O)-methyltransferase
VSRGGLKLVHALDEFALDVRGMRCADFGCNVGGFTDCLLQRGAASVVAMDTGYGTLAWKLRQDARVSVRERTNALHAAPPGEGERVDLVVIDMGWTPQRLCVPAAMKWLAPGGGGRIVTLIKPHYEVRPEEKGLLVAGVLPEHESERIAERAIGEMAGLGAVVLGCVRSPIEGGAGKKNAAGNAEWLALLAAGGVGAATEASRRPNS